MLAVAAVAACAALPATARAGSYDVLSCAIDGGFYPNNAWVTGNNPAGDGRYQTDTQCSKPGTSLSASLAPNNLFSGGTWSGIWFYAPPGTTVSNYKLVIRHYWYAPALPGYPIERTYTALSYGPPPVSGAGRWMRTDQDLLASEIPPHWYGYRGNHESGFADTGIMTVTRAGSPHAMASPEPTDLRITAGCYDDDGTGCTLAPDGGAYTQLYGSRVTVHDDVPPTLTSISSGTGLMAPGLRSGGEGITFSANDNVGIRRADIVDITDPARPTLAASQDYAGGATTGTGATCDFTGPRPCPDVKDQTIAASPPIGGHRTLVLRVTDAAGNQTFGAPFGIVARGPLNGVNGGDAAKMIAGFPRRVMVGKGRKRHRGTMLLHRHTVRFGRRAHVRGILSNAAGLPIAGANIRIFVRDQVVDARYTDRGGVTTGPDGRFRIGIPRGISRDLRLAYKAFLGDDALAAHVDLNLGVRAKITLHGPRRIRPFGIVRFHGRLVGRPRPPHGVVLELQALQPRHGWRSIATTRSGGKGRYVVRHRFASGFGRFVFRMRMRRDGGYPYALGVSRKMRVRVG